MLLSAAVLAVLLSVSLIVTEACLQKHRNYLCALEQAGFTKEEAGYAAAEISANGQMLALAIDSLTITEDDKLIFNFEGLSYDNCNELLLLFSNLCKQIAVEKIADFVSCLKTQPKINKLTIFLALKYNSKDLRNISLPQGLHKLESAVSAEKNESPADIAQSGDALSGMTKFVLNFSQRYSRLGETSQKRVFSTISDLIQGEKPPERRIISLLKTIAESSLSLKNEEISALCLKAGELEDYEYLTALSAAPLCLKNAANIIIEKADVALIVLFFDLPDTDKVAHTLLDEFYSTQFYLENSAQIDSEITSLTAKLQELDGNYADKEIAQILSLILSSLL